MVHAKLEHENVLNCHHVFENPNHVVMVLESGEPLAERVLGATSEPVSEVTMRKHITQVLEALKYLHG